MQNKSNFCVLFLAQKQNRKNKHQKKTKMFNNDRKCVRKHLRNCVNNSTLGFQGTKPSEQWCQKP